MTAPDGSEEWINTILDAVVSDVAATGYFDYVNEHEPLRKSRGGITAAVWVQHLEPIGALSGLASTSGRILFTVRLFKNMQDRPTDEIDPRMWQAASSLMRRYHDNFDFNNTIRNVDLLGSFGVKLFAQAGYLPISEGVVFRIIDIQVPCLVNDIWPQVNR
jgi:hypothetical protein